MSLARRAGFPLLGREIGGVGAVVTLRWTAVLLSRAKEICDYKAGGGNLTF